MPDTPAETSSITTIGVCLWPRHGRYGIRSQEVLCQRRLTLRLYVSKLLGFHLIRIVAIQFVSDRFTRATIAAMTSCTLYAVFVLRDNTRRRLLSLEH